MIPGEPPPDSRLIIGRERERLGTPFHTRPAEEGEPVFKQPFDDEQHDFKVTTETRKPNGKKVQVQLKYELGAYKVISITNTTVVHPGQMLDPKYVQKVCDEYDNWEVTMVDNDIAAQVFGFVRGLIPL